MMMIHDDDMHDGMRKNEDVRRQQWNPISVCSKAVLCCDFPFSLQPDDGEANGSGRIKDLSSRRDWRLRNTP